MNIRRIEESEIIVGQRIAVRYYDPSGPNSRDRQRGDRSNMSTEYGKIVRIIGSPTDPVNQSVVVLLDGYHNEFGWHPPQELDYFGSSLYILEEEGI